MYKKILLLLLFSSIVGTAQVDFPHNSASAGFSSSERVSNFTVQGAGNDRLEIVNGTQNEGRFIPTFWSYRDTDNTFSMVFTSSISTTKDTGNSPLMLFTTTVTPQLNLNAPSIGDFVWGASGTSLPIVTRPLFEWRNASTKLVTITANGNFGIGTSSPTALLHTLGSVRFQNLENSVNPVFMLGTDSNGNVFEYPVPQGTGNTSDSDWLRLDNALPTSINDNIYTNGKVAINTNVIPNTVGSEDVSFYNLFVKGGILTEEVRVAVENDWADYVFKEDYELPTLHQIEEHIKSKGHLINIPSEKEVKENGIELGKINKLLLEKIEELTLHMIDLNKKLEIQQKEMNILKQEKK